MIFTASDWNTPQTVTITGLHDDDSRDEDDDHLSHQVDGGYPQIIGWPGVPFEIIDDDVDGVTIEPLVVEANEGGVARYTVVLHTEPISSATVTFSVDTEGVTFNPTQVRFTGGELGHAADR